MARAVFGPLHGPSVEALVAGAGLMAPMPFETGKDDADAAPSLPDLLFAAPSFDLVPASAPASARTNPIRAITLPGRRGLSVTRRPWAVPVSSPLLPFRRKTSVLQQFGHFGENPKISPCGPAETALEAPKQTTRRLDPPCRHDKTARLRPGPVSCADVAQLVRASDCGSEGRWFESTRLYHSLPHLLAV